MYGFTGRKDLPEYRLTKIYHTMSFIRPGEVFTQYLSLAGQIHQYFTQGKRGDDSG
jgi:hypothetical protein